MLLQHVLLLQKIDTATANWILLSNLTAEVNAKEKVDIESDTTTTNYYIPICLVN